MERDTLSVDEVAARLGLDRKTVYAAIKCREIPSIRIGARILVPRIAFERFLESPTTGTAA